MIKLNYLFEKNAIHKEIKNFVSLIQINGEKEINKKEKRKLNISISIDISGSMGSALKTERVLKTRKVPKVKPHWNPQDIYLGILPGQENPWKKQDDEIEYVEQQYYDYVNSISKIEQAKNAAIKAVEKLNSGDYISIVCFDDTVDVLVEATKITTKNKKVIIDKIKTISVRG